MVNLKFHKKKKIGWSLYGMIILLQKYKTWIYKFLLKPYEFICYKVKL
jgi:hypothetical protein